MTRRALDYAEQTLGVHQVHEQTVAARDNLDEILDELSKKKDERRKVEATVADREMELLIAERGKHPDMAVAAMDRHMKILHHTDSVLQMKRAELRVLADEIEGLEYDKSLAEHDIRIGSARMIELGGYLTYLAAVKNATPPASTSTQESST